MTTTTIQKRTFLVPVQLVTVESERPLSEVIARLDQEINKTGSASLMRSFGEDKTREELVEKIQESLGEHDFVHFLSLPHGKWLNKYFRTDSYPDTFLYTYGNPLIATSIMQHDIDAGLNLPPRILVTENKDRTGTKIIYYLPSSLIAYGTQNAELIRNAEELDAKMERLVQRILS